jgi:hypothetical protein
MDPRVAACLDPAVILLDFLKTLNVQATKAGLVALLKKLPNRFGQVLLVVFDLQDVIPTPVDDLLRHLGLATQSICCGNTSF